jgi:hypothetical protein
MKKGKTIKVNGSDFIVLESKKSENGSFDVVLTKAHMKGIKFYGNITIAE